MTARLDIDALRALATIADQGGVTRAAERLGLSQSAVSHKIRRLEESIDSKLLSRKPGAPLLTESGRRLLGYAERILSLHDEALQSLSKRTLSGKIRLGVTEDTTSSGLARVLARFARLHPRVSVRTHVEKSLMLQEQLKEGVIDLAVLQIFADEVQETDTEIARETLHWVKALDADLPPGGGIPFIAFDPACSFRHWAGARSETLGRRLEVVLECPSSAGVRAAVEAGMGVALLTRRHLTRAMERVDATFGPPPDVATVVRVTRERPVAAIRALAREVTREFAETR